MVREFAVLVAMLIVTGTHAVLAVHVSAAEPQTPPTFAWAISAGGKQHDKTRGIAVDSAGNVLLTGEFTGTATFGEYTLTSVGDMDFFVAKVDPQGTILWARSGGGAKVDRGYAITADAAGNSYVTGHYDSPEAMFDQVTIKNAGEYDLFVAKYDAQGKLVWIKSGGGPGYDYGHGIAADKLGQVFVTGAVVGEGTFAAAKLGHPGPSHIFCLALSTDCELLWSRAAEGTGSSSGHGIAVDHQGNCYAGGYAGGVSEFGGQKISNTAGQEILVAKFDGKGKLGWLHAGYGSSNAMIHEITADAKGNVWAAGMFKNELKLADRVVVNQGQHDMLLTSFDAAGQRLWTKTAGGPAIDYGLGVATDGKGNSFLTGSFAGRVEFDGTPHSTSQPGSDIQIVKYDRHGTQQWFLQAGSDRTDHAYTIVADSQGNLYLSGACSGAAKFGSHDIPNRGSNDVFLAKISAGAPPAK